MPILRDTPPPLPASVLKEIREGLPARYGSTLVTNSGKAVLVVRVPYEAPDPQRDIGVTADLVTLEEAGLARDVLLMGEDKTLRVDPIPLRDAIRERMQADVPVSKEVRRQLPHQVAAAIFTPATRRVPCIAVRLPRVRCKDATQEDLEAMRVALEPVLEQAGTMDIPLCYMVADDDFRRFTPEGLVRVLTGETPLRPPKDAQAYQVAGETRVGGGRKPAGGTTGAFGMLISSTEVVDAEMATRKQARPGKPGAAASPAAPAPAPAAPAPLVRAVPPAPPVTRAAGMQALGAFVAPAAPTAPAPPLAVGNGDAAMAFADKLRGLGFEVLPGLEGMGATFAAHQEDGKRLLVTHVAQADAASVTNLLERCKNLEADGGVLLADSVAPGAWMAAVGTPVALLPASSLDTWL